MIPKLEPLEFKTKKKPLNLYIFFVASPTFPSGCYKPRGKFNISCSGYNKKEYFNFVDQIHLAETQLFHIILILL